MEVKYTEGFFKSLKRIVNRRSWYWKILDFIQYDLPNGIKNIFFFWRVIWNFRGWDSSFQMRLLARSLEPLAKCLETGNEIDVTRLRKVAKIKRAIEILNYQANDDYIELAEKEIGYETNTSHIFEDEPEDIAKLNRAIYKLSDTLSKDHWNELFHILKGQDHNEFISLCNKDEEDKLDTPDLWENWYDGSGLAHWWD
jgi:hypothetical protein